MSMAGVVAASCSINRLFISSVGSSTKALAETGVKFKNCNLSDKMLAPLTRGAGDFNNAAARKLLLEV